MKIEMGESLVYSWLKHVRRCAFIHANWKAPLENQWRNVEELADILGELRGLLGDAAIDILGNDNIRQFIRQTECDEIGLNRNNDGSFSVTAMEVAIHLKRDGLHYNGIRHGSTVRENVSDDKVPAKLIGIAFAVYACTSIRNGEISFATPIADEDILGRIRARLLIVENCLAQHGFNFSFHVYANEAFYTEILRPVLAVVNDVSDTGELFVRAMQIYLASASRWSLTDNPEEVANDIVEDAGDRVIHPQNRRRRWNIFVNDELYNAQSPMTETARKAILAFVEIIMPGANFDEIRGAFPLAAHGGMEVVVRENEPHYQGHYSEWPISLNDGTRVLVCNQWCGTGEHENWTLFRQHAGQVGIVITEADNVH